MYIQTILFHQLLPGYAFLANLKSTVMRIQSFSSDFRSCTRLQD